MHIGQALKAREMVESEFTTRKVQVKEFAKLFKISHGRNPKEADMPEDIEQVRAAFVGLDAG